MMFTKEGEAVKTQGSRTGLQTNVESTVTAIDFTGLWDTQLPFSRNMRVSKGEGAR